MFVVHESVRITICFCFIQFSIFIPLSANFCAQNMTEQKKLLLESLCLAFIPKLQLENNTENANKLKLTITLTLALTLSQTLTLI